MIWHAFGVLKIFGTVFHNLTAIPHHDDLSVIRKFIFYDIFSSLMAILPIDTGRYGTAEMLAIFSEQYRIDLQVMIEEAVAVAQGSLGIIPVDAAEKIDRAAMPGDVTPARIAELEAKSDHDTAALVEALAEKCQPDVRPWLHYGLTSNDLVDTTNSLVMRDALGIIIPKVKTLAGLLLEMSHKYADLPAVGRTHGQHASIMSFGLKFANWAVEMVRHIHRLRQVNGRIALCKTLGVVGTGSMMGKDALAVQDIVADILQLRPILVATQVVPRERYAEYVFALALLGSTLDKMAVEIRNLQRTEIGEVAEQFKKGQMGSSAVPVKRNPIKSERVSSLAKLLRGQVSVSMENIPLWHERDLSNSANERFILPTASILIDEMLETMIRIIPNLVVNRSRISENLEVTKGQIYAEFVMKALVHKKVTRMDAYRHVQRVAFKATELGVHLQTALKADSAISDYLYPDEIDAIFKPETHLGSSAAIIQNAADYVNSEFF